jgi:hypothetical protein
MGAQPRPPVDKRPVTMCTEAKGNESYEYEDVGGNQKHKGSIKPNEVN